MQKVFFPFFHSCNSWLNQMQKVFTFSNFDFAKLLKFATAVLIPAAAYLLIFLTLTFSAVKHGKQIIGEVEAFSGDGFEYDENLQTLANSLLPLFENMPPVPVYSVDEPILKSGANTETGLAYTHCYNHEIPKIFIKKDFYQKTNNKFLTNIVKHELTHAWLCRQRLMNGHDERFRKKFAEVGGVGN
jgi:SprT-like family.